jgi:hypothetical protein
MPVSVDWIAVGGDVAPWHRLGLVSVHVDEDGRQRIPLFGTGVEVDTTGWLESRRLVMSGVGRELTSIDGITIEVREAPAPMFADHPLGARSIDHVVVATDDLGRTSGAIADATGAALKRVRETGEVRQGFHQIGGLIVEVVERGGLPVGPASVWGLVLVVDDLDAACTSLGANVTGEARDAVQPGRRIATLRSSAGLGIPVALMSPDPR